MEETAPAQPNQSIMTGIAVLQEVVTQAAPVGSRDLARRMGIEHSRINRILGTLVHMGMLRRDPAHKYSVGGGVHVLSAQSLHASRLLTASLAPLGRLQERGATVALGTVWRDVVCYLLHARPGDDLAATAGAHDTFPVEESVIGAVMRSDERVVRWDRADRGEVSWAAAVGTPPIAAIAAVFPAGDRIGGSPATRELVARAAREIEAALSSHARTRTEGEPS
ncbi:MAG: helix-turn-helix domain-containing protein [Spirochaetota bacterium]